MITISANDEFRILERVQECAADLSLWPTTLECADRCLTCRSYLLEFQSGQHHTGRYCAPEEADELIYFLDSIQTEASKTALMFLLNEAALNYPYCKIQLATNSLLPAKPGTNVNLEFANWPGLITPVLRTKETTVLLVCLWTTISSDEIDPEHVMSPFRRFAKAVSSALSVQHNLSESRAKLEALQLLFSSQDSAYCLLDEDRTILFSTPAWQDVLSEAGVFTVQGDRLVPTRHDLEMALKSTSGGGIYASPEHLPASNLRLDSGPRSERYVFIPGDDNSIRNLSFRNLGSYTGGDVPSEKAHILVEIKKTIPLREELKDILQSHYGLSNGEARLAFDLASSGSLPDTLANLGITRNTAKTHLRRIYEKTSTQSQLELTHVIHGLSSLF